MRLWDSQVPIFIMETVQFLRELSAFLCSGVEFAIGSSRENATFMSEPGEVKSVTSGNLSAPGTWPSVGTAASLLHQIFGTYQRVP
jgi:hypothetical protein